MELKTILDEVKKIILKYANPERIYLYGSRVSGEARETSDIDIAYDAPDFRDEHLIAEEVLRLPTLLKIDVKNLSRTEERFKNRVKSTGTVLYSASKKLRFEDGLYNFIRALDRFSSAIERRDEIYREGFGDIFLDLAVKRFEFTYEMAWKALKRYLDFIGIEALSPRTCFREAYQQGLIADQGVWLEMIEQRNLSSHVYSEIEIEGILSRLDVYRRAFADLGEVLENMARNASAAL